MSKDRVSGVNPLEPIPSFVIDGLPLVVIADLPSGGFLTVTIGENPMGPPSPGPQLPRGSMLALIVPPFSDQIRPHLEAAQSAELQKAAEGRSIQVVPRLGG